MPRTSSKTSKTTSKIVKSIPSSDNGPGVVCYTKSDQSGDKYIIGQNPTKKQFTLWKCVKDGYEKISTSNSPMNLYDIIPWELEDDLDNTKKKRKARK